MFNQEPQPNEQLREGANRRRFERTQVPAAGRLMVSSGEEHACQVADISENGIALHCLVEAKFGEKVIVYLDQLGRFEGTVIRFIDNGFAIETKLAAKQRQRLIQRVNWMLQGTSDGERRIAPRRAPTSDEFNEQGHAIIMDGLEIPFTVVDISVTGANLRIFDRPRIGTSVTVGKTPGRVVRHTGEGVAVEFVAAN